MGKWLPSLPPKRDPDLSPVARGLLFAYFTVCLALMIFAIEWHAHHPSPPAKACWAVHDWHTPCADAPWPGWQKHMK